MRALVTGGVGFIGSHLVRGLLDRDWEVRVIDDHSGLKENSALLQERADARATYFKDSILDEPKLKRAMIGVTHVFHLAALPRVQYSLEKPVETTAVNVNGTVAVLKVAADAGVERVVFASSSSVYGDTDVMPLDEGMQPNPMSPYALQKLQSEQWCKLFSRPPYNLSSVCLRFFNVYGPMADPHGAYALVVGKFIEMRRQGIPLTITGDGTQTRDFTYIDDVVKGVLLAAEAPQLVDAPVYNIGAGNNVSVNRVAELIGGAVEYIAPRLEPHDTRADNLLAREDLGWEPKVSLEEGIARTKKYYQLA